MTNSLKPIKNGPLKLDTDSAQLTHSGTEVPYKSPTMLCRCGRSANKPFCDGSHNKIDFTSERESDEDTIQEYAGQHVRIQFNRSICSGAAKCVKASPKVFSSDSSENWIFPDQGDAEEIAKVVDACPSGALSMSVDGTPRPSVDFSEPSIEIVEDGPYLVQGIELNNVEWHSGANSTKYALCRCGLSANKPFCDYSHAEKGWRESDQ